MYHMQNKIGKKGANFRDINFEFIKCETKFLVNIFHCFAETMAGVFQGQPKVSYTLKI